MIRKAIYIVLTIGFIICLWHLTKLNSSSSAIQEVGNFEPQGSPPATPEETPAGVFLSDSVGQIASTVDFMAQASELLRRVRTENNVGALVEAEQLFSLCLILADEAYTDQLATNIGDDRLLRINRAQSRCSNFRHEDFSILVSARKELLRKADAYALAKHFRTPESSFGDLGLDPDEFALWAWEEATINSDPHTVAALLDTVFNRWDSPALEFSAPAEFIADFNSHPAFRNSGEMRARVVRRHAFDIIACQLGADCRPNGLAQELNCISFGYCNTALPLDQYIALNFLSTHERDAVNALAARFRQGVR